MPQICSQLTFLLPLKNLVVPWPPLLIHHISFLLMALKTIHVPKKYVPVKGRVHIGYCCRKHGRKICYKNKRFYCSTCSDEDKNFYYCQDFSKINLPTRTCFLEHQHYISLGYGLLLCLSSFHLLLYLLNLFCACFLPVPLITHSL